MEKSNAIVITGGYLDTNNAKTAHGLIRGTTGSISLDLLTTRVPAEMQEKYLDGQASQHSGFWDLSGFY
jgi:hypothetical protein